MKSRGKEGQTKKDILLLCIKPKKWAELLKWYQEKFKTTKAKGLNRMLKTCHIFDYKIEKEAKAEYFSEFGHSKNKAQAKKKLDKFLKKTEGKNNALLIKMEDGRYKTNLDIMILRYPETLFELPKGTIDKNNLFKILLHAKGLSFFLKNPHKRLTFRVSTFLDNKLYHSQYFKNGLMIFAFDSNKNFDKMKRKTKDNN